jgi:protein TonB
MSDDNRNAVFLDEPKARTAVAAAIAVVLWCAALGLVGRMLVTPEIKPAPPATLDAQLVEIEPPAQPAPTRTSTPERPVAPAQPAPHTHEHAAPPPVHQARPVQEEPPDQHAAPMPAPAAAAPAPMPPASPANHAPAAADVAANTGGRTGARAITQPLPEIPDDLRELAYHAIALARFTIHPDGSSDVELVQPTQNPRLNQLLLASLHNWRFFPATENGKPVESHQDVRVHLVVQ